MHSKTWAILVLSSCLSLLTSCGGPAGCPGGVFATGGCSAGSSGGGGNGGGGNLGGSGGGGGAPSTAVPVIVQASQTAIANIAVVAPVSTAPPNVQAVGVDSNGFAYATGGTVHQGEAAAIVTLFGAGIASGMTVNFSGPPDITVTNMVAVTATDGTPGLQFNIAVASTASLGARTLILQNSNNDITTFAGGIEIIP